MTLSAIGLVLLTLTGARTCDTENTRALTVPDFAPAYEIKTDFTGDLDFLRMWEYTGLLFFPGKDGFILREKSKAFAYPSSSPYCGSLIIRARIKVTETVKKDWKIAGIGLYIDDDHYWQLAVVEEPDVSGKKHFAELAEMYGGTWLSQYEKKTRLTALKEDRWFEWKYGRVYEFILMCSSEGITGYILDAKGTVKAHIAYRFDNEAVIYGRPAIVSEGFVTSCLYFEAAGGEPVSHRNDAPVPPPFQSRTESGIDGTATGFYHTERIDGIWWVVDPAGSAVFIIGTDHVSYNGMWCEALGYSPYRKNVEKRYENEDAWADSSARRLQSWGFNALGAGSSLSVRRRHLPYPVNLNIGTRFAEAFYITPKTTWTGFPDVFHPGFGPYCEQAAKKLCAPLCDDPWLIGYFLDNELEWHQWTGKGLFADTFSLPPDAPAKTALVSLFRDYYTDITLCNREWGLSLKGFDSLLSLRTAPEPVTEHARGLINDYIRLAAETYFSVTTAAIKKYDPHHMILGCRFAGRAPGIWNVAGEYCDIVSVNCYRTLDLETGKPVDGFEDDLSAWHEEAKKPFMITEWSFPALDAGLPCRHGAGQRVPTQTDRAFAFTSFQKYLFTVPFVVGSNYFMWVDQPASGISSVFPEDSNYGLLKETDEPHELLTEAASRLNPLVYEIHRGHTTDFAVEPVAAGSFSVTNRGGIEGKCTVFIYEEGEKRYEPLILSPGETKGVPAESPARRHPGFRYITCVAVPEQPLLETTAENNRAVMHAYLPGTPWHSRESGVRIPVCTVNGNAEGMKNIPVVADIGSTRTGASGTWKLLEGTVGTAIPADVLPVGDGYRLMFLIEDLPGYGKKDCYLYKREGGEPGNLLFPEKRDGVLIDNGVLRVEKISRQNGTIFDSIGMDKTMLGSLVPLVWQRTEEDRWVGTDITESVAVTEGKTATVMTIILANTHQWGKKYRICYRLSLFRGLPWFESRVLWIENTDTSAWFLKGYYHYALSFIGGDASGDDDVLDHWEDRETGYCYGVVPAGDAVTVRFWTDEEGNRHPDAYGEVLMNIPPGKRLAPDDAPVLVAGCRSGDWWKIKEEIKRLSGIKTIAEDEESR